MACPKCGISVDIGSRYCCYCGVLLQQVTSRSKLKPSKSETEPIIRIQNLTKFYGETRAVDGLTLDVEEGEILGLLGPNGAGKSSTLLMLTTVIKPSSGTATVMGYDIEQHPYKVRQLVGLAFQEPKLYWINTPSEILTWHAKVCRTPRRREVVEDIMRRLELWESRKKMAHELSGGQKKRVEIAKLFIQKPKIAIFDEPTAQIDVSGKFLIWDMIKAMRDDASTIILATNELSEADRLSDRVAILHKGKLRVCDSPRNLKDSLHGGDVVELRLEKGMSDELIPELRAISDVVEVKMVKPTHLRIYLNRAERNMPKIMSQLISLGVNVASVSMKEPSLDDVFLHYTGLTLEEAHMPPVSS